MSVKLVGIAPCLLRFCGSHSHDDWEIILNLTGGGKSVVDNKEYDFSPGTITCIPPNVQHSKYPDSSFLDIFIHVDSFPLIKGRNTLIFFDDEEKSVETLMYLALRIFHKKEKNYMAIVDSIGESIIQLLLSKGGEPPKNDSIELFKNELIKNFTNPEFKISEAMSATNYCSDHFRRCFKKDTGETPVSYLNQLRIEFAKNMLSKKNITKMNISEIALNSGFYDSHYFSRIFKKTVGVTPVEYINRKEII